MRSSRVLLLLALALCGVAVRGQAAEANTLIGNMAQGVANTKSMLVKGSTAALSAFSSSASAVGSAMAQLTSQALAQGASLQKQLDEALAVYEKEYCTQGVFTPGSKKPAKFVGQSFALTFNAGECYFNDTALVEAGIKELSCTEPSITFVGNPANFTSSYHAAGAFTSKYCAIQKSFGEPMEQVLYTFDGSGALDLSSIADKVSAELSKAMNVAQSSVSTSVNGLLSGLFPEGGLLGGSKLGAGAVPKAVTASPKPTGPISGVMA